MAVKVYRKRSGGKRYSAREKRAYWIGVGRGAQDVSNLADYSPDPRAKGKTADKIQLSFNKGFNVGRNANKNDKITYL